MSWRFDNPEGYTLRKIDGTKNPIRYDFQLDFTDPLTLVDTVNGSRIQPDRHAVTDMGSIPTWLQPIIGKDRFLITWLLHDSGYQHGGLYISAGAGKPYEFCPMTRLELDQVMLVGLEAEGCRWITRRLIYRGVRLFGARGYRGQ